MDAALAAPSALPIRTGHSISDVHVRDSARVHIGDNYSGCIINPKTANLHDFTSHYKSTSLRQVASYVERPALQKELRERLHDTVEERGRISRLLVICGLGGAGKSQLALNYIETYRTDYSAVFWIDAGTKEALEQDYTQIYRLLRSPDASIGKGAESVDTCILEVKQWCHRSSSRLLFVLDSADDVDTPEDPGFIDLRKVIPDAACVDVIVTTRCQSVKDMTSLEAVQVAELALAEARQLFVRRADLSKTTKEIGAEIDEVVEELGRLALAVTLAGAYIATTPRLKPHPGKYLVEYRKRQKALLDQMPKPHVDQYSESVLTTWETSHAAIAKKCPEAVNLLTFLAFLSPNDIFLELFDDSDVRDEDAEIFSVISPDRPIEGVLDAAFEELVSFSFLVWRDDQVGYSMHKLVHEWGYERLDKEAERQTEYCISVWQLMRRLTSKFGEDPMTRTRIGPHIMACYQRLQKQCNLGRLSRPGIMDTLNNLSDFLRRNGQWNFEYELRMFAYNHNSELGPTHPDTLTSVSNLGSVLQKQGKYEEAEKLFRQALKGYEKALGLTHPYTLTSLSNLGLVLGSQGKYEVAEKLFRQALEGREKALGPTHPDTLTSVNNLGLVLQKQGKYEEAEKLFRQALEGREKALSPTHPDMLGSVNNLGLVLRSQGKYEEAERLLK
ncbi:hypothetical protein Q7P35_010339 [Cladosporium inversicolor]